MAIINKVAANFEVSVRDLHHFYTSHILYMKKITQWIILWGDGFVHNWMDRRPQGLLINC